MSFPKRPGFPGNSSKWQGGLARTNMGGVPRSPTATLKEAAPWSPSSCPCSSPARPRGCSVWERARLCPRGCRRERGVHILCGCISLGNPHVTDIAGTRARHAESGLQAGGGRRWTPWASPLERSSPPSASQSFLPRVPSPEPGTRAVTTRRRGSPGTAGLCWVFS